MKRLCLVWLLLPSACATSGKDWMREPYALADAAESAPPDALAPSWQRPAPPPGFAVKSRTLGEAPRTPAEAPVEPTADEGRLALTASAGKGRRPRPLPKDLKGKVLGTFRNTYYDFPSESDFSGEPVTLHGPDCRPLASVARAFYEAVCVQGSGLLANGSPVSFNRRDCACAELCPKTQQRICFDALELGKFPWGRGALGHPITPLLTVAVDSNVIALGTSLYIPEFEGLPRDASQKSLHDGCFVAQDRGLKVQGKHVDIFTGLRSMTQLWNGIVPSNSGVTVVVDSPKCERSP